MTIEEFKTEVEEAARIYLTDYNDDYSIEWDLGDEELPRAEISIKPRRQDESFVISIGLNESNEAAVEAAEDTFLPLDGESFYTVLFYEALDRLRTATKA